MGADVSGITRSEIREVLIEALAEVDGLDPGIVDGEVAARGGDAMFELDSKVAECVLAVASVKFGIKATGPADLQPEQYANLEALLDLLESRLCPTPPN